VTTLSNLQLLFVFAAIVLVALSAIGYAGIKLAERHGGDVRIVWYIFSLSSVCTCIASMWAGSIGAIDSAGVFQGRWGPVVNSLLMFMLDVDTDVKLFAGILAIYVIPQIASYGLSGLFGCASAPIFVGRAVGLFVWSVVKSLVVASGVLLSLAIYGWIKGWIAWNQKGVASMSCFSLMLLVSSFGCLYMYRDIKATAATPSTDKTLRRCVDGVKAWLTRNAP
jgi:hypothetical protein